MNKRIRGLSILMIVAITILTCNVCFVTADAYVATGSCGENATWTLDNQGLLTISGTGEINWDEGDKPNKDIVTSLVIGDGITEIGAEMFSDWTQLTEVTFGNTIAKINQNAFECCGNLDGTIKFPKSLEELDYGAFCYCDKLDAAIFEGDAPEIITVAPIFPDTTKVYYYPEKQGWDSIEEWICHECIPFYSLTEEISRIIVFSDKVPNKDRERILAFSDKIKVTKSSSAAFNKDKVAILTRAVPNIVGETGMTWEEIMSEITNNPGSGYNLEVRVQTVFEVTDSDLDNATTPYVEYSLTPNMFVSLTTPSEDKITGTTELRPGDFSTVPISITVPLGKAFVPKTIEHTSKDGKEVYEVFTSEGSKTFTFDPTNNTVTIQIQHFSNIRIAGVPRKAVDTGDSNNLALYSIIAILSFAGAGFVSKRRKCESDC